MGSYAYSDWLDRMLPNREQPPEVEITEDMLRLRAFRVQQKEVGPASLQAGDAKPLTAISQFGAKPYIEDEAKALSAIVASFKERHGTRFAPRDCGLRAREADADEVEAPCLEKPNELDRSAIVVSSRPSYSTTRRDYREVPPKVDYAVTPFGQTLVEALMPLCVWGNRHRGEVKAPGTAPAGKNV